MYTYLVCSHNIGIPRTNSIGRVFDSGSSVADNLPNSEEAIRRGEYAVIRSLTRVLEVLITSLFIHLFKFIIFFDLFIKGEMSLGWC